MSYSPDDYADDIRRWATATELCQAGDQQAASETILAELDSYRPLMIRTLVGVAVCGSTFVAKHGPGHYEIAASVDGAEPDAATRVAAAALGAYANGDQHAAIQIVRAYAAPDEAGVDRLLAVMAALLAAIVDLRSPAGTR